MELLNRKIQMGGDFYQKCYDISIDSINVLIISETNYKNIINSVINGFNQEDYIIKKLYEHIESFNIKKHIYINSKNIEEDYIKYINNNNINNNLIITLEDNFEYIDLIILDIHNIDILIIYY